MLDISFSTLAVYFVLALSTHTVLGLLYNITLHPLAPIPGPIWWAASQLPHTYHLCCGNLPRVVKALHDRYGPIVRISPSEISFISAQAWRDIYGARSPQLPKDHRAHTMTDEATECCMAMEPNDSEHARQRSQLVHGFTSKALRSQETMVNAYISSLITVIRSHVSPQVSGSGSICSASSPQDIAMLFNWTTFDISGSLVFGSDFSCLRTRSTHPWIKIIFDGVFLSHRLNQLTRYNLLWAIKLMIPRSAKMQRMDMLSFTKAKLETRLNHGIADDKPDIVTFMLREAASRGSGQRSSASVTATSMEGDSRHGKGDETQEAWKMSVRALHGNAEQLTVAGSETTATLLSGLTFLLLHHRPDYMKRLTAEIRGTFDSSMTSSRSQSSSDGHEIAEEGSEAFTAVEVAKKCPLLIAAINEALRFYPPVPSTMARLVERMPRSVDGQMIPPGTSVGISQWAANHSNLNWHRPDEFLPERWLAEYGKEENDDRIDSPSGTRDNALSDRISHRPSGFERDTHDSFQPFSTGPRNCLGRGLAEMELRLIYARLLWNFDLELEPGQDAWLDEQNQSLIWEKKPLMVRFIDVRAGAMNA